MIHSKVFYKLDDDWNRTLQPQFSSVEQTTLLYWKDSKSPIAAVFSSREFFSVFSKVGSIRNYGRSIWRRNDKEICFASKWTKSLTISDIFIDLWFHVDNINEFGCLMSPRNIQICLDKIFMKMKSYDTLINEEICILATIYSEYKKESTKSFLNELNLREMDINLIKTILEKPNELSLNKSSRQNHEIVNFFCVQLLRFAKNDKVWVFDDNEWKQGIIVCINFSSKYVYRVQLSNSTFVNIQNDIPSFICKKDPNIRREIEVNQNQRPQKIHKTDLHLQNKNQNIKHDSDICITCQSEISDAIFIPCGHLCMCIKCASQWGADTAKCPICMQPGSVYRVIRQSFAN